MNTNDRWEIKILEMWTADDDEGLCIEDVREECLTANSICTGCRPVTVLVLPHDTNVVQKEGKIQ